MKKYKGRLINVTGVEGTGKSTQVALAAKEFGDKVICTREPGGTPTGENLRKIFLSEDIQNGGVLTRLLLAFVMRRIHFEQKIRPALEAGKLVICDRFDADTWAYQICAEDGRKYKDFFWQLREQCLEEMVPDLYIHFDMPTIEAIERKKKQDTDDKNIYDEKPLTFHHKVYDGLKEFMALSNITNITVDAAPDPEIVWQSFKPIIEGQLAFLGH